MKRGQLEGTLGVGIDTREISNFNYTCTDSFLTQNFTKKEIKYCFSKTKPAFYIAKIFAVKNAVLKAIRPSSSELFEKSIPFLNVEITFKKKVIISFSFDDVFKEENKVFLDSFADDSFNVSLSHKKDTVTAVVVRERNSVRE